MKNVLPLVETSTFFFPSTSPHPGIPIPMMRPPTEVPEPCLPGANSYSLGHAHHTPSPQTVIPHATPTPLLPPHAPLLAGGVGPAMVSGPNQLAFTAFARHVPSPQTVIPHTITTPPFPPAALSGPKQSAPSLSHASCSDPGLTRGLHVCMYHI